MQPASLARQPRTRIVACVILLGLGAGVVATVQGRAARHDDSTGVVAPMAPGMRVAIQPESGALVPPDAEQAKALAAGIRDDAEGIEIQSRPDGSLFAKLDGHYEVYDLARRGPDGRFQQTCVTNAQAANSFLQQAPAPAVVPMPAPAAASAPVTTALEVK